MLELVKFKSFQEQVFDIMDIYDLYMDLNNEGYFFEPEDEITDSIREILDKINEIESQFKVKAIDFAPYDGSGERHLYKIKMKKHPRIKNLYISSYVDEDGTSWFPMYWEDKLADNSIFLTIQDVDGLIEFMIAYHVK